MFADVNAATTSAQLLMQLQAIRNTYSFTLDQRYCLLDPMDIVTLTDTFMGLSRQPVRITEITENDDGSLSFSAEEYPAGLGQAAQYSFQTGQGFGANYNEDPGNANTPIFLEPTDELAGDLELDILLSGGINWGGADVWTSADGTTYGLLGRFLGKSRVGTLTASLASVTPATTGPTIDNLNTIAVDISESAGLQLLSGSQQDMLSGNTLCDVDGELISYQTATLTGTGKYTLSGLNRGMFGSPISAHLSGTQFGRLDGQAFRVPYTQDRIGSVVYFKFLSFNTYQSGQQSLASVQPYSYTLQGTALASPLPDVTGLNSVYSANQTQITWNEITDFRPLLYEIRLGASQIGGQVLGRLAHPPFTAVGDGTYWIAAVSQPVAGLTVYSAQWESITIVGATLNRNIVGTFEEDTTWTGTFSGGAAKSGTQVVLGSSGNVLTVADYLGTANILNIGTFMGSGTYTIPTGHQIDVQRVAPCLVTIAYSSIGQATNAADVLGQGDFLGITDFLANVASMNVDIFPQIQTSPDAITFGAWQDFIPGIYNARKFNARMQLVSNDPQTEAILETMAFTIDAPDRIDDYIGFSLASGGTTLTYQPNGSASTAPFNAGPGGASLPQLQITILGQVAGDIIVLTSQTLSSVGIQVKNGGVGAARTVNVLAKGY